VSLRSFHVAVDADDVAQLHRALASASLSGGSAIVKEYEAGLAGFFGVRHALAFSSGTTALHGSLAALDVGPGDEVLLSAAGTIEAVLAVLFQNALPVFVDVEPHRFDVDLDDLRAKLGPRTKAVVCVPMWGYPLNVDAVAGVCAERGVPVVEDIALSAGAAIGGRPLGTFGIAGCASTHERKPLSTGEGGFTLTDDARVADRMREIQRYGIVCRKGGGWDAARGRAGHLLGWNYKVNAFTAAFGLSQLAKLADRIRRRRARAAEIAERLADCPGAKAYEAGAGREVNGYALVVDLHELGGHAGPEFAAGLRAEGVVSDTLEYGYRPLYEYPILRNRLGYAGSDCPFVCALHAQRYEPAPCPNAEAWTRSIVTLPTHEALTNAQVDHICDSFRRVYRRLARHQAS
jgi:dTDP-4-amino-4,6-dideoxygalactose transaminase